MALRKLLMFAALAATALAAALVASGWALAQTGLGTGPRPQPQAPGLSTSTCARTCKAAYSAIAAALPHERGELLARAILTTPAFDYLQLARSLHIPTRAQIHAQWRRSCLERFPSSTQSATACIRTIDSWTPIPLPARPSSAAQ